MIKMLFLMMLFYDTNKVLLSTLLWAMMTINVQMYKEWTNFVPQDLDKFIISIYDFAASFEIETELAWFGISEKWEVKESYRQHMPKVLHGAMTTDERKATMMRVFKVCPDAQMYKQCRTFIFSNNVASTSSVSGRTSSVDKEPGFEVIAPPP